MTELEILDGAIRAALGPRVRDDAAFAPRLYGSLANVEWQRGGAGSGHTFRDAARLVADMRGRGEHFMRFYCSAPEGVVDAKVAQALAAYGYVPEIDVARWLAT